MNNIEIKKKQYIAKSTEKTQIYLCHSVSGDNAEDYVASLPQAPHYVIDRKGNLFSAVPQENYSRFLGVTLKDVSDFRPDEISITIVLLSYGVLLRNGEKFYKIGTFDKDKNKYTPDLSTPVEHPYEYCPCAPFRNFIYYEMYTDKQLATLRKLLQELIARLGIDYHFDPSAGAISQRAIVGQAGIYLRSQLAQRFTDCHPQRELLNILKSI
jgi:N-acetyl-anhydromuramyl-L-alanine amidase AmpD